MVSLVATKPYDAITIEDVTEAADVARATFYAHFKDKTALLEQATRALVADLTQRIADLSPRDSAVYTGAAVIEVFEHAGEHRDFYRLLIRGEGGSAPRDELIAAFESAAERAFTRMSDRPVRAPIALTTTAFVGALLLTLDRWLGGDPPHDPRGTGMQFLRAQVGGLEWALGFEPGETRLEPEPTAR